MLSSDLRYRAFFRHDMRGVELYALNKPANKVRSMTITEQDWTEGYQAPVFWYLPEDEAQAVMTALWDAGVRPASGEGSSGQLAATERHLADMKAIAFHKLGIT